MIVPGSEEIKGLLGSRGIALFFFGSEGRFGVFSPSTGHWPSLSVRADILFPILGIHSFLVGPESTVVLVRLVHYISWIERNQRV